MTGNESVTRCIAAFAASLAFDDIPGEVAERGKIHILDSLGLALCGARSSVCSILMDHLSAAGVAEGPATVLGTARRMAPRFAALANATAIHADNFDDTNPQVSPERNGGIHATGPVLAAALAVAEARGMSGKEMLAAFHAGVEVSCRLNHAIAARHYEDGFHSTGTLNVFGSAVAAGRLLGLDADGLCHVVAAAASRSAGIRRNFGSLVEPLHAGHAAEDGVVAAELAAGGVTGAAEALEGAFGFFQAVAGGYEAQAIVGRLGAPWAFADPGMWIKPFPNGALTHAAMTGLLDLIRRHDIRPEQVRAVRARTNRRIVNTLIHHDPKDALQAKFSMEFALAILLLRREAGLAVFTDDTVARPEVREMMGRVALDAYDRAEPGYTNVTTLLEVDLAGGRTLSARADHAKGSTRDPMSADDVTEKFRQCAAHASWPESQASSVVDTVMRLERLEDLRTLTAALAA